MEKRKLGRSEIAVSPFCFGGNVFGWTADEKTSFQLLDAYVDQGFEFIDTADVYSAWAPGNHGGESETIIGKWLKSRGKRDRVVIATKVGKSMGAGKSGLSAAYIREAVNESLKRLQTDYIDLYQSHEDDPSTPLAETLAAFGALVREGKVRIIGASNYTARRFAEALSLSESCGLERFQTLQPEYNLYDRVGFEDHLQAVCLEKQIGVLTYYSLASGFLTGKYRSEKDLSKSMRGQGIQKYLNDRGMRILDALDGVSVNTRSSPAAVALAWLLSRPAVAAPIASATSVGQLEQLLAATRITLDSQALELLNSASDYQNQQEEQLFHSRK